MPTRACPQCARRLPYAGRRCIHCDWVQGAEHRPGAAIAWWRRTAVWALAVILFMAVTAQYAYRNAALIADWYANYATQYLHADSRLHAPANAGSPLASPERGAHGSGGQEIRAR